MTVYKDPETSTWSVNACYCDWKGEQSKKHKRGFATKREAQEWKREFLYKYADDLSMTFEEFFEIYSEDRRPRLKLNTWLTKEHMFATKILPFFGHMPMNEITAKDIVRWQNELMNGVNKQGNPYSPTYLKVIHNQITAVFTHAYRLYGLKNNPAAQAGSMGEKNAEEMSFWTREEYRIFAKEAMAHPRYYCLFEVLYWTGMRVGEALALTPGDINFEKKTISVTKSYQRLQGRDVITSPKTTKSKRVIAIPTSLCFELKQYLVMQDGLQPGDRLFAMTRNHLGTNLKKIAAEAGVKPIRVHDLRHSHVSHLIELGYSAVAIADRLGHRSVEITLRYAHLFPHRQEEIANKLESEMGVGSYGEQEKREEPRTVPDGRFQVLRFGAGRTEQAS